MSLLEQIRHSNFLIKLKSWEYWPFGIVQFPIFIYFAWLALRTRSLTFFSASNPGIAMGGMFGESKFDVLNKIPRAYIPRTILLKGSSTKLQVLEELTRAGLSFPLVFKPDLGERGFRVTRINNSDEVGQYLSGMPYDFLAQEFIDLPLEFGIFYARRPSSQKGKITSIVMKEMLAVIGDGKHSLQDLIFKHDRAKLQWDKLRSKFADQLHHVVPDRQVIELVSIGNHCLGTKFINRNDLINETLSDTFDTISQQIDGFYFGRYDLRCASIADLYAGRVMIMELNGCGAEPAHIYHPGFPLLKGVSTLFTHWRTIFEIARENHKRGIPYINLRDAMNHYRIFKQRVS